MSFKKAYTESPLGIKILSVIYYLAALIYLAVSIVAFTKKDLLAQIPDFSSINFPLEQLAIFIGIIFFFLAVFAFFVATGLIKKQKWSRIALIIFAGLNALGGIKSIIDGNFLSGINVAFNLFIAIYLIVSKKVRKHFE